MTKKQLLAVGGMMLLSSALVSVATLSGGIWYLQHATQAKTSEDGLFSSFEIPDFFSKEEVRQGPSFHPLEKIVLSIKGNNQTHFVMLELAIETRSPERMTAIDNYMPVIQNALLKLFADKHYNDLQEEGAIENLQSEVKNTLITAFNKTDLVRDIDDVLLTKYVVQ
ncbi:flagellar basal body-associated FliL family protein [Enterovibrio sp. ZSDZ35]|uniref:Flagellar protein FliL n=1 Tax=Enterovibrio qingdaonensis TaxID=2899818 RepID=A0ABT5QLL5_9GAMM|nr:flagellar basal body-associated FliL family protein [Enterovibrio sp. ZSDZ35]MDD1781871.1 flagellar basal body-associated FliL family protein [Enterovibrio sp. ZSDZ35]